ncbi:MAG: carbohydrate ABC transporter permease [Acholeplasmatales bacterium]|jgi:multiple sugar transport system permease protein|nr:carbohydrate ABC transporter permease [Acholeplasmatales bacterium]
MKKIKKFLLSLKVKLNKVYKTIKLKISKINKRKIKKFFFGTKDKYGFIYNLIIYGLLIIISFIYLYPLLYMISGSLMDISDMQNPTVYFVPTKFYLDNYRIAFEKLDYFKVLFSSLLFTVLPSLFQTISISIIAYGFARFKFPLRKLFFALSLITYVIIPQITMLPKYMLFSNFHMVGNILSFIIPATTGQGLNSAIFLLIFYQFYRLIPIQLEESAEIDGASKFKTFYLITLPLVKPAIISSFLFSLVWYWNETYISDLFLGNKAKDSTLQLRFLRFASQFNETGADYLMREFEGARLAAMLVVIIPLIIVYVILQRKFVEGIDAKGLGGE